MHHTFNHYSNRSLSILTATTSKQSHLGLNFQQIICDRQWLRFHFSLKRKKKFIGIIDLILNTIPAQQETDNTIKSIAFTYTENTDL